jgi:integrase
MPYLWPNARKRFHRRPIRLDLRPFIPTDSAGHLLRFLGTDPKRAVLLNAYAITYTNTLIQRAEAGEAVKADEIDAWFAHLRKHGSPPRQEKTLRRSDLSRLARAWLEHVGDDADFDDAEILGGHDGGIAVSAEDFLHDEGWTVEDDLLEEFITACITAWTERATNLYGDDDPADLLRALLDDQEGPLFWTPERLESAARLLQTLQAKHWLLHSGADTLTKALPRPLRPVDETSNPSLAMILQRWIAHAERGEKYIATEVRPIVDRFLAHLRERGIETIGVVDVTPAHAQDFADLLKLRPVWAEIKRHRMPNSLIQQADLAEKLFKQGVSVERISAATYNKHVTAISTLFSYAVQRRIIQFNPFQNLHSKGQQKVYRDSFTAEELQRFFSSTEYHQAAKSGHRWVPLLCITMGLRRMEAVQLLASDIRETGGIAYISVNEISDAGAEKTIKTDSSAREIPIPEAILKLGFLDFAASVRARGQTYLFIDDANDTTKRYADELGKWFSRVCDSVGITSRSKVLHSLRHTFCDFLDEAEIDARIQIAITGHADKTMRGKYGNKVSLKRKHKAILGLNYGFNIEACVGLKSNCTVHENLIS